jgi:cysteinyl-tRNA synthetase
MAIAPDQMFRNQPELYSEFDAEGIPTKDAEGKEISKSMQKKLKKDQEKQKRLYESNGK